MQSRTLSKEATGLVYGLIVQFLLGMISNLFVAFPEEGGENQMWEFARTQLPVVLHILIGFGLLFGSISLLIHANKAKDVAWLLPARVGFAGILVAFLAGARFIPTQGDSYSLLMAIAFIVALVAYGAGLARSK